MGRWNLLLKIVADMDDLRASIDADPIAKSWFATPSTPKRKPILHIIEAMSQNLEALVRLTKERKENVR